MTTPSNLMQTALEHHQHGELERAESLYRQVLREQPDHVRALVALGAALQTRGDNAQAKACYARACELQPRDLAAHFNLATILADEGQDRAAETEYRRVLDIDPAHRPTLSALWLVYLTRGELDQARAVYDRILAVTPDDDDGRFFRGSALLLRGDFLAGWPGYEYRGRYARFDRQRFPQPLWDGSPLAGRTLLVHCEQGFGDTMQFIRYVRLAERCGGPVLIATQEAMIPLLRQAGFANLIDKDAPMPDFDLQSPLLSLPGIFQTTLDTIPAEVPYLSADAELTRQWRERLARYPGLKVGLIWQGSKTFQGDAHRSIPLRSYEPLARVPGVTLLSLQQIAGTEQIAEVAGRFRVTELTELGQHPGAFMDSAAVMKNLDLLITSDTAPAHLAGALGVPTWLAISVTPDWRWLLDRDDCPWYPTMRLFRQSRLGDWSDVFARMADELQKRVDQK